MDFPCPALGPLVLAGTGVSCCPGPASAPCGASRVIRKSPGWCQEEAGERGRESVGEAGPGADLQPAAPCGNSSPWLQDELGHCPEHPRARHPALKGARQAQAAGAAEMSRLLLPSLVPALLRALSLSALLSWAMALPSGCRRQCSAVQAVPWQRAQAVGAAAPACGRNERWE